MKIKLPKSNRKRALIVVDIQEGFIEDWSPSFRKNVAWLLSNELYALYIEATFYAPKGSLWEKQTGWTFPYEPTVPWVLELLKGKKVIQIKKNTRSTFKGNINLEKLLRKNKIEELHIIGFDTGSCVYATTQEAFDKGFFTYVIEECVGSSDGMKMHKNAISVLRKLGLTNHS